MVAYFVFHVREQTSDCDDLIQSEQQVLSYRLLRETRTKRSQMNNMRRLVLLKQFLGLFRISVAPHNTISTPVPPPTQLKHSPQIALRRRRENPSLPRFLAKPRSRRFSLDDVLDGLADEPCASGDEYDRHGRRRERGRIGGCALRAAR